MICRLLATRCCISCRSTCFWRSRSSVFSSSSAFSSSIARRAVMSVKASRIVVFGAGLVEHLAGVQQHDPAAEAWEIMVDLEAVHGGMSG